MIVLVLSAAVLVLVLEILICVGDSGTLATGESAPQTGRCGATVLRFEREWTCFDSQRYDNSEPAMGNVAEIHPNVYWPI